MARASDKGEEGVVFEDRVNCSQKTIPFPVGVELNCMKDALKIGRLVEGIEGYDRIGVRFGEKFEVLQN